MDYNQTLHVYDLESYRTSVYDELQDLYRALQKGGLSLWNPTEYAYRDATLVVYALED